MTKISGMKFWKKLKLKLELKKIIRLKTKAIYNQSYEDAAHLKNRERAIEKELKELG